MRIAWVRCGESEIGVSDSAAEAMRGLAGERNRGFGRRRGEAAFKGSSGRSGARESG